MTWVDFPYAFSGDGRTATTTYEEHIRDMIEQVLFTAAGERVNRPNFGSGLSQLIFSPNSDELAATTQFLVQGALQEWLGDLIQVEQVQVKNIDERLHISIDYLIRKTQTRQSEEFVA